MESHYPELLEVLEFSLQRAAADAKEAGSVRAVIVGMF